MPFANSGGVKLHCEEVGQGTPILFVHEMGSDIRQWEQQLRWFGQRFRCIAYDARGYLPLTCRRTMPTTPTTSSSAISARCWIIAASSALT